MRTRSRIEPSQFAPSQWPLWLSRTLGRSGNSPQHVRSAVRADLEGLRGVAVLLVVLFHAGIRSFQGGFIGVDVFFVLSGYLITSLLVAEAERTGALDFGKFYARRARRLLPAAVLVTIVTLLASALLTSPIELTEIAKSARATAAYLSNVRFMLGATDYFAATNETNPLLHTWSLAVEEQFYLLWPFLLWLGIQGTHSRARVISLIFGVTLLSFAGCVWLTRVRQPWAFFGSPARAWEFGVGGLACLIPPTGLRARRQLSVAVGVAGFLLVCLSGAVLTGDSAFPGLAALVPVLGTAAVLVAGVGASGAGVGRLLGIAPLQYLGRLSYSWYLWHWPVLILAAAWLGSLAPTQRLTAVILSLGIAAGAYRVVENPIRYEPRLLSAPASRSLWLAAVVTAVSIAAATGALRLALHQSAREPYRSLAQIAADRGRIYADGCMVLLSDATPKECTYGDPVSSFTVVAFGDSHTAHWFPALDELSRERGWRLVYLIKSGCPSADLPIYSRFLKRVEPECSEWRNRALARIDDIHPNLVVLSNSSVYVKRPGVIDATASLTPGEWQAGMRRTLSALQSTGAVVLLLRDSPRPREDIPRCLARAARRPWETDEACSTPREQALNEDVYEAEVAAARGLGSVSLVDLTSSFCDDGSCGAVRNGIVVYRDDSHITPAFARRLTPVLGDEFSRVLGLRRNEPDRRAAHA